MAGVAKTISVDLGAGLVLPTPVMIASGCAGTGTELSELVDLSRVGGVVSRSITLEPERGSPTPRIGESASGIVWATGLQNPGVEDFVERELPALARGTQAIVSIAGTSMEEYVRLAGALQGRTDVSAIEVYLAGPDLELSREMLGLHVDRATEIVGAVARTSLVPVFAKIPLWGSELVDVARGAMRAGAHGLVLGSPPPALVVDAASLRPSLGSVHGWLSGPAIKPLMLRAVFDVSRELPDTPVIAVGGISDGDDAVEALLAGAWAVQVGTAAMIDPGAPVEIARGIVRYLKDKGMRSPADVRARLRVPDSMRHEDA